MSVDQPLCRWLLLPLERLSCDRLMPRPFGHSSCCEFNMPRHDIVVLSASAGGIEALKAVRWDSLRLTGRFPLSRLSRSRLSSALMSVPTAIRVFPASSRFRRPIASPPPEEQYIATIRYRFLVSTSTRAAGAWDDV